MGWQIYMKLLVDIVFIIYKILFSVSLSYWKRGIYCTKKRD